MASAAFSWVFVFEAAVFGCKTLVGNFFLRQLAVSTAIATNNDIATSSNLKFPFALRHHNYFGLGR